MTQREQLGAIVLGGLAAYYLFFRSSAAAQSAMVVPAPPATSPTAVGLLANLATGQIAPSVLYGIG